MAVFTNQASLTYNDVVIDSNIVTGRIIGALAAAKRALTETYLQGDTITYVISITNSGTAAYTNLVITDDLGTYTVGMNEVRPLDYVEDSLAVYVNGVLTSASADPGGDQLVITGVNVPAGGNALVIYQTQVNQFAPLEVGAEITNTATISYAGLPAPIVVTETITAAEAPDLSITKALTPETVVGGSEITYTLTLQNRGNAPAEGIVVTDDFDPILQDITVTYNGMPWAAPTNYTYNEATGLFRTVPGQITLPAADFTQDPATGAVIVTPSTAVIRITGTI